MKLETRLCTDVGTLGDTRDALCCALLVVCLCQKEGKKEGRSVCVCCAQLCLSVLTCGAYAHSVAYHSLQDNKQVCSQFHLDTWKISTSLSKDSELRTECKELHLTTFSSRSVLVGRKPARSRRGRRGRWGKSSDA